MIGQAVRTLTGRGVAVERDVAFGARPDQRLDLYRPRGLTGLPALVFFHGGGWRSGTKRRYAKLGRRLAGLGLLVAVPTYRLFPEVTYPDFLMDCAAATTWLTRNAGRYGGGGPLFLMGHSAGAYNAVMLGLDRRWLGANGTAAIAGVIGLAGPYDFLPITRPNIMPVFPDATPDTQPVFHARNDAPPLLLLTGKGDRTVKPRNTMALSEAMRASGGRVTTIFYPYLGHVGILAAILPPFGGVAPVLRNIQDFIRAGCAVGAFPAPPDMSEPCQAAGSAGRPGDSLPSCSVEPHAG